MLRSLSIAASAALLLGQACRSAPPAASSPAPAPGSAPVASAAASNCEIAGAKRARVSGLLAQGKLDRAVKVMRHANELCPDRQSESQAALVAALAELGMSQETRQLADEIEKASGSTPETRAAAARARAMVDELDKPFARTAEAKGPMWNAWSEAIRKREAGSLAEAAELFVQAWKLWRPNGQALVEAGLLQRKLGNHAEAQRLLDRGLAQLEQATHEKLNVERLRARTDSASLAWSRTGLLAVADGAGVSSFTPALDERVAAAGGRQLAISADGTTMATLTPNGSVSLADAATGDELASFPLAGFGGLPDATALSISPDGKALAIATTWNDPSDPSRAKFSVGPLVIVLELSSGKTLLKKQWQPDSRAACAKACKKRPSVRCSACESEQVKRVYSLAFSPDGKVLAASSDDAKVRRWQVATGKAGSTIPGDGPVFSPDGRWLAVGALQKAPPTCQGFCPDLRTVHLWDVAKDKDERTIEDGENFIHSMAFSPDGKRLFTASGTPSDCSPPCSTQRRVVTWDAVSGARLGTIEGPTQHPANEDTVAFSPDGKYVATIWDYTLTTWNLDSGDELATLPGFFDPLAGREVAVGLSPRRLFSSWSDGNGGDVSLRVLDLSSGGELARFQWDHWSPGSPVPSPSGDRVVLAAQMGTRTWSVESGKTHDATTSLRPAAFSPDGRTLIASCGAGLCLRDADTLQERSKLPLPRGGASAVAFAPDGKKLAIGSADGPVLLWDLSGSKETGRLEGHQGEVHSLVFSRDGSRLASRSHDDTVRVWDVSARKELVSLAAPSKEYSDGSVAFSADRKKLVVGLDDTTVRVFDAEKGTELAKLVGHTRAVKSVGWSDDGKVLFSSAREIILWRGSDASRLGTIVNANAGDASYLTTPAGFLDILGDSTRSLMVCRVGRFTFPLAACEERLLVRGLLGKLLAGDQSYQEP